MSIKDFFVKEKPVFTGITRGVGGFGFGGAGSLVPGQTFFTGTWASGGVVGDYESGGTFYRVHVFVEPGTFAVSDSQLTGINYLVVGGGGGGGGAAGSSDANGGGGAGGFRSNHPDIPASYKAPAYAVTPGNYDVTVGDGGAGGIFGPQAASRGGPGSESTFTRNGVSYPNTQYIRSYGGGGGGSYTGTPGDRNGIPAGGSGGGGGGGSDGAAGTGSNTPDPNHPAIQGRNGGTRGPNYAAGGGGGIGSGGTDGSNPDVNGSGAGGAGLNCSITGTTLGYAGGGGGGGLDAARNPPNGVAAGTATHGGGVGSKGDNSNYNSYQPEDMHGRIASGGGGGGMCGSSPAVPISPFFSAPDGYGKKTGGMGGPGIVAVSYQIPGAGGTAKATGGIVTFTPSKTIHTFTEPGTWTAGSVSTIDILAIGGGGAGGAMNAGGGGAGAVHYKTNHPVPGSGPFTITIGRGGRGSRAGTFPSPGPYIRGGFGVSTTTDGLYVTAAGGGGAGSNAPLRDGLNGGSGGGASDSGTGGTGSGDSGHPTAADVESPPNGWGNNGANSSNGSSGGGGGGGGTVGGTPPGGNNGGAGGNGITYTISGSSKDYAGGGGGGSRPGGSQGAGGPGGGGAGSITAARGSDGATGTGSGGGGGCFDPPAITGGGNGGSGIVIISYPK